MVIRVIVFELPDPKSIGVTQTVLDLANFRQVLVLVTGPAGCGKSTTLTSMTAAETGHLILDSGMISMDKSLLNLYKSGIIEKQVVLDHATNVELISRKL